MSLILFPTLLHQLPTHSLEGVICGEPNEISNGNVTITGIDFGSTGTYRCHYGYILSADYQRDSESEQNITCHDDGQWYPSLPTMCNRKENYLL